MNEVSDQLNESLIVKRVSTFGEEKLKLDGMGSLTIPANDLMDRMVD